MTHALRDLLAGRFDEEPPEISGIKDYVKEHFNEPVAVALRDNQIIITTRGAALAGALRPHLHTLAKLSGTKRRLVIRIG